MGKTSLLGNKSEQLRLYIIYTTLSIKLTKFYIGLVKKNGLSNNFVSAVFLPVIAYKSWYTTLLEDVMGLETFNFIKLVLILSSIYNVKIGDKNLISEGDFKSIVCFLRDFVQLSPKPDNQINLINI